MAKLKYVVDILTRTHAYIGWLKQRFYHRSAVTHYHPYRFCFLFLFFFFLLWSKQFAYVKNGFSKINVQEIEKWNCEEEKRTCLLFLQTPLGSAGLTTGNLCAPALFSSLLSEWHCCSASQTFNAVFHFAKSIQSFCPHVIAHLYRDNCSSALPACFSSWITFEVAFDDIAGCNAPSTAIQCDMSLQSTIAGLLSGQKAQGAKTVFTQKREEQRNYLAMTEVMGYSRNLSRVFQVLINLRSWLIVLAYSGANCFLII